MTNSQRLAEVRERLCDWLAEQPREDSEGQTAEIVGESVLIVDGFYCGRRFDAGRCYAIWFIEEDQLKIHAAGGELLCVFSSEELRQGSVREAPTAQQALQDQGAETNHTVDVISLTQQLDTRAGNDEPAGDENAAVNQPDDSDDIRRAA